MSASDRQSAHANPFGVGAFDFDAVLQRTAQAEQAAPLQRFLSAADDRAALQAWIEHFVDRDTMRSREQLLAALEAAVAAIDHRINRQLNALLHAPAFQRLESSWRGLWYLVSQLGNNSQPIKIKVLDLSWSEAGRDISRALEFDQSQLFQKIYNEGFGIAGGEPFGVLIGDYEVSHRPCPRLPQNDIETLGGIAQIAAAAFAPFITAAAPELFGLDQFSDLKPPLHFDQIFAQQQYIAWQSLRDNVDTRFVGLTLPKILMRKPYQRQAGSYKGLFFYEYTDNKDDYLWGSASYAFGAVLLREFASVGWFGHIRGVPRNQIGGGVLTNLPADCFDTDAPQIAFKPVTDTVITDALERDLSEQGFIALCQCWDTPLAAFYSNPSLHKPRAQLTRQAQLNNRLSAMLQHVLCCSRITHYLKVIIRDKVGSFMNAEECEEYLRRWLFEYTTGREDLAWEEQARYPLREAQVEVREDPIKPGSYSCIMHLRPHYQLDQMITELELATELTQRVKHNA